MSTREIKNKVDAAGAAPSSPETRSSAVKTHRSALHPKETIECKEDRNVHSLFEAQVRQNPDALAIRFEGEAVSYAELNAKSNRLAHALLNSDLSADRTVAILLETGPRQVEALFGVLKTGCSFVCLDPNYPTNRLRDIAAEVTPPLVITESACTDRHQALLQHLGEHGCEKLVLDAAEPATDSSFGGATSSIQNPDVAVDPGQPAYIVYTSGSTGKPKGIVQSHRSFGQFIEWQSEQFGITTGQRFAQWASIGYDASYCEIFGTLCFGATLCMADESVRYNPRELVKWLRDERVTILQVVPSFCRQLVEVLESEQGDSGLHPLPELELLLLAGERLPVDLARTWLHEFPDPPKLFNLYGPSETVLATYYPVDEIGPNQMQVPIGRAIAGREILILDEEYNPCPVGVRGEIYIRSQYLTMGYFKRPDETAEKFVQNPLHGDYPDPTYRTGDQGAWRADGSIDFYGRIDNLVKLHGIRVELGDIESVLRTHVGVRDCAVIVREARGKKGKLVAKEREARETVDGGGAQVLAAYFTGTHQLSSSQLRHFLERNLPIHMIPQQFVQLDELPLNANRKLDVKALPELDSIRPELKQSYVAPRNAHERRLTEIWRDVLNIDRVGIHDGFFELGGDSLLAMQVLNRTRETTDLKVSFRDLFEKQTVAELASAIAAAPEGDSRPRVSRAIRRGDAHGLSLAQQGVWFLAQLEPDNPYYTAQGSIHFYGELDLPALQRAWDALLERHMVFRARFATKDGTPIQRFEDRKVDLPLWDLTHLPEAERRATFEEVIRDKGQRALDLEKDPLLQADLFKISEAEYEIALTFHEIILDLWALSVMMRDLAALYEGFLNGEQTPLPPLRAQFSDYIAWENEHIRRELLDAQRAYWEGELSGELPVLSLPTDRPYPVSPSYLGSAGSLMLDAELAGRLKTLSVEEDATLFTTLLAAFDVLLHVYSGQDDLIVGAPIANRSHENTEDLVGFFLNMLPLRSRMSDDPSFRQLMKRVRQTVTGAIMNSEYPFMWMLETAKAARDTSTSPVFQVMFNMLNLPHTSLTFDTFDIEFSELDTGYIKYDLALYAQEHGDQIFLQLAYLTDLFDSETIDRMLKNLVAFLESAVARPDSAISELKLVHDTERHKLLYDFNDTNKRFDNDLCIHQLFEQQAARTPADIAYLCQGKELTYAELNTRANQLARYLRKRDVGPESVVAICAQRSFEMVVGLLGIMKAGGAYVALDPDFPLPRLLEILDDTGATVMLLQEDVDRFDSFAGKKIFLDADWQLIEQEDDANPDCVTTPENLLNVVYTSSTEGKPKGTLITMDAVLNRLFWMWDAYPFQPGDVAVLQKSYALVAATWELFGALLKGVPTLILTREDLLDPARFWEELIEHNVTHLLAVPALLQGVLDHAESDAGRRPPLRLATTSAEPISPAMVGRWKKAFPNVPLLNLYGSTECASNVTCYDCSQLAGDASRVPVGRPLANTQVYVLDGRLNPVPIGVTGEMCVSGACLARGYLNLPELNESRFIPNPFSERPESRLYRTGDLARYRSDGIIELLGREDNQVKVRGFRVELDDVEIALSRHELVKRCAVKLHEDENSGDRLVAYVMAQREPGPTVSELQRFLRLRLPEYMVPSAFMIMDELPLTPTGKVDRRALEAPDAVRPQLESAFQAPRTPAEEVLASTWAEVLGLDGVGVHDNFFELGGHSLLATQVISRIREALRVELPLRTLFQLPTVAGLAAEVARLKDKEVPVSQLPTLVPAPDQLLEPFPLTDVQQAYWIGRSGAFELGNIATHFYAEVDTGSLDLDRFTLTWRQLIQRHEMCRAIVLPDGQQQILQDVPDYVIDVMDLRGHHPAAVESELDIVRQEMSHQVLKSDEWPLFDIRASRLDDHRYRLHFSFDALMFDAWSKMLLFREWYELYSNVDAELPPIGLSFRDYVLADQALRDTELHQRSLEYWLDRIDTLPPAPELPLAKSPGSVKQPRFVGRTARVEPEIWLRLKNRANRSGLTPSGICLAAFAEILKVWSKSPRFTINLTLFNRLPLHPQVNDVVGDFTSLTLLEVNHNQDDTFEARARRLQEQLWDDLDHRYVTGVRVLRELAKRQRGRPSALMPVVFTSVLTHEAPAEGERNPMLWMGDVAYSIYQTPQVWLDHSVVEQDGALELIWNALEELFPETLLDDMFDSYQALLKSLAEDEESWRRAWPETARRVLPTSQLEQRAAVNATEVAQPDGLLHDFFMEQARERPDHPAVVAPDRTLTYEELYRGANRIGRLLREQGARPNELVPVVMEKGWEQVVAVLGVLASGAAYLPVDARLPKERLWHLLDHGQAKLLLTQPHLDEGLEWPDGIQRLRIDPESVAGGGGGHPLEAVQKPEDLAYVIYTSGSTGLPKGVVIDHRGAVNTVVDINKCFNVGPEDRVLALSSLNFDLSVWDIFGTLAGGGTIVVPEASGTRDPAHWARLVEDEDVTIWNSVPALMQLLVEYVTGRSGRLPASLRLIMMSGDWIPVTLPGEIRSVLDDVEIISLGGATEASIWSISYPIGDVDPAWPSIPYGKPMANQRFYVLNEALEPCPLWVAGELYIGGIGLAKGYWRDEDKTRERFIIHPRTGERLYRTGDLGRYLPDGNIEFLGRDDFQVKIQGHRIELGEIEAALLQHEGIRAAVVTAIGERHGHKRLVAYVIASTDVSLSDDDLRKHAKQKLPEHMVPSGFVFLDELPLSPNGKVDRDALPEPAEDRREPGRRAKEDSLGVMPRIAGLIGDVLGLDEIDHQDDLLYLGANSVDMIRIVNRMERELDFRPKIDEFYRAPTVFGLAKLYEQQHGQLPKKEEDQQVLLRNPTCVSDSFELIRDPGERDAFKRSQPWLRRGDEDKQSLELDRPKTDDELQDAYVQRRSHRQFLSEPIPFSRFSDFLSCLRQVSIDAKPKSLYGSAGGLYPVQTYVYVKAGRVDNVSGGIYYYHPLDHRLVRLSDSDIDEGVYDRLVNRPIFDQCAFALFLIADMGAIAPMYGEWSTHFSTIEAGQMTQLIETTAPACSLGVCQIGSLEFERIRHLFALSDGHVLVHSLLGGQIDPSGEAWTPFQEDYSRQSGSGDDWEEGEI